jgi:hypothetical protein
MRVPSLSEISELFELFAQIDKTDAKPNGRMMNVSVQYVIHLCFSDHPLVLGSFQQFLSSSA